MYNLRADVEWGNDDGARIRPDDKLIDRDEVRELFGRLSVSALYADPELMALRVVVVSGDTRPRMVRWIRREALELRARRVARSARKAASVRAAVEQRRERRR